MAHEVLSGPRATREQEAALAISASGLVKDFGTTRALDGLDLSVRVSA